MKEDKTMQTSTTMNFSGKENVKDNVLDRDKSGKVSVSPGDNEKPSYTYNADKSDPIDPHLSDNNPPDSARSEKNVENNVLDRDKSGKVSVSSEDNEKPSYTYNVDKSDPIDPHLADLSGNSK